MKISKLFHWLYAILMLLPIGMILGRTLYAILNPNAFESFTATIVASNTYDIDNAFISSIYQLNTMPLFSWAQNSFIAQPFLYITNLFGMDSSSPIITLLSYWFSISIIWLVFDLFIYVPLLVHRWIDKGVLE